MQHPKGLHVLRASSDSCCCSPIGQGCLCCLCSCLMAACSNPVPSLRACSCLAHDFSLDRALRMYTPNVGVVMLFPVCPCERMVLLANTANTLESAICMYSFEPSWGRIKVMPIAQAGLHCRYTSCPHNAPDSVQLPLAVTCVCKQNGIPQGICPFLPN